MPNKTKNTGITLEKNPWDGRKSDKMMSLDDGVIDLPGESLRLNGMASILAEGEDPNGLMVQTPNGTSRQDRKQREQAYNASASDRWTKNAPWNGDMTGN